MGVFFLLPYKMADAVVYRSALTCVTAGCKRVSGPVLKLSHCHKCWQLGFCIFGLSGEVFVNEDFFENSNSNFSILGMKRRVSEFFFPLSGSINLH